MNDGPWKLHTGYLVERLELFIRKVAYLTNDATSLVRWSNYSKAFPIVLLDVYTSKFNAFNFFSSLT
jgi:hypothetical protein